MIESNTIKIKNIQWNVRINNKFYYDIGSKENIMYNNILRAYISSIIINYDTKLYNISYCKTIDDYVKILIDNEIVKIIIYVWSDSERYNIIEKLQKLELNDIETISININEINDIHSYNCNYNCNIISTYSCDNIKLLCEQNGCFLRDNVDKTHVINLLHYISKMNIPFPSIIQNSELIWILNNNKNTIKLIYNYIINQYLIYTDSDIIEIKTINDLSENLSKFLLLDCK